MSDKTELKVEEKQSATMGNPLVLMNKMIERNVDPDALKKMMDLSERWQATQAKAMFATAMNQCQRVSRAIVRNAENLHTKKRYADLEAVNLAIQPIYTENGFSISFSEEKCDTLNCCRIVAKVQHVGGHSEPYWADIPLDGQGAKGNANMTPTQAKGSTLAYGRRYLLCLIFNLTMTNEDTDGAPVETLLSESQLIQMNEMITDIREAGGEVDMPRFLNWILGNDRAIDATIGDIPSREFGKAMDQLKRKFAAAKKEAGK